MISGQPYGVAKIDLDALALESASLPSHLLSGTLALTLSQELIIMLHIHLSAMIVTTSCASLEWYPIVYPLMLLQNLSASSLALVLTILMPSTTSTLHAGLGA